MAVSLKPLGNRVLIEPDAVEKKTASGILIPEQAQEKPLKGKVVACGPGINGEKMAVKEGDAILYSKYSGTEISLDGKNYLMMKEPDIFAIIVSE